jgi:hypothetical protein
MRRGARAFALLTSILMIAAACSKPKSETAKAPTGENTLSALDNTAPSAAPSVAAVASAAPGAAKKVTGAAQKPSGYQALNPTVNAAQAAKVGALVKPQSTEYANGNPNSWAGVTKDEIKLAFSIDESNCGVNVINAVSQAGGNFGGSDRYYRAAPTDQQKANAEVKEALENIVKYWNEAARDYAADYTQITPILDKFNKPGQPFFGRKLTSVLVDGGSFQCPDRTTAGAVKIAQEIKPFSVFTDDVPGIDGSGYNMVAALNAKAPAATRPMHFGSFNLPDKFYTQFAPYAWNQFASGTAYATRLASWLCSRVKDKPASNSVQFAEKTRKFGLAYPNVENMKAVVDDFKSAVNKYCGKSLWTPNEEFAYSTDVSRAGDEGTQMMVKFQVAGVTSLIYFSDPIFPLFQIVAAKSQNYRPEWVWSGLSYTDTSTVQRLYMGTNNANAEMVDKASFGLSAYGNPGGWGPVTDPFYTYHRFHQVSPTTKKPCDPKSDAGMDHDEAYCKAPGTIATKYYTTLAFVAGVIFAGPDLTPLRVSAGLQNYPKTRYAANGPTDDPRAALVGAGPGQYYFISDSMEWRWRSKYKDPYPEDAPDSHPGYVEFPDCQRHYYEWPDKLSLGWEKGGPIYNSYCGDPKYAPKDSVEKDGFPRWEN